MPCMSAKEIRNTFLRYFQNNDHQPIHSASLVPTEDDKSLLFTNAGMVPFKNLFLGYEQRDYRRAVSIQRCLRAGGKHNDLENVGYTSRHHTFFEMLGNFSFGDYFKQRAIHLAWFFLTKELALPKEKLWITIHHSDDEAAEIWHRQIGVAREKIIRCGDEDNFWSMGSTGPCGPCSEIFYDHGEQVAGGPPGSADEDGDRYVEIWNLVFMQFNRDVEGNLTPLPKPSVDTGMGLERIAAVLQGKTNNYDTDELSALLAKAQSLVSVNGVDKVDSDSPSFRVLADHIRACAFLIADGVLPSNEGRGYVLRRIIRRAIRHGHKVGIRQTPFFDQLLAPLVDCMGENYPELVAAQTTIRQTLAEEELRFSDTLHKGLAVFRQKVAEIETEKKQCINGDLVFYLYDTFGFPVDLTADMAREMNLSIDYEGFDLAMQRQKNRAREAMQFNQPNINLPISPMRNFIGYEVLACETTIVAIFNSQGKKIESVKGEDSVFVILQGCPFYSESGGQVSDTGVIQAGEQVFLVKGMHKQGEMHICYGALTTAGELSSGEKVSVRVDEKRRHQIEKNHSSTHLLHHALRLHLGDGVVQKGSLVDEHKLRFDFSHYEKLSTTMLLSIEREVNAQIQRNDAVQTQIMLIDEAKKRGAMALFGEKYGQQVRVVTMGQSIELCGGTHVDHCGDIGVLKIVSESGIAQGIRRIEALSGDGALAYLNQRSETVNQLSLLCQLPSHQLPTFIAKLLAKHKQYKAQVEKLEKALIDSQPVSVKTMGKWQVIVQHLGKLEANKVRQKVDHYKQKLQSGIVVVATASGGKGQITCGVTDDLVGVMAANVLVNRLSAFADGRGGGRANLAMASANPEKIELALAKVESVLSDF